MNTAIGVCLYQLVTGKLVQLLPAGVFRARDGRPNDVTAGAWRLTADDAATVIAAANAQATPFVIDYEHQTLLSSENGQPAPAAGWFKTLTFEDGKGLYSTDVAWTGRAQQMIDAEEYKFLSPVFLYDKTTGAVLKILHAALTNNPGLDGMQQLASQAALRYLPQFTSTNNQEHQMDKKLLARLLGLAWATAETVPATADTEIEAAVTALKTKADQVDGLTTQVAALKSTQADPTKYVPIATVEALKTQIADLSNKVNGSELDGVVVAALKDGKLLPAQEQWARDLGAKDIASLKSYIEKTPAIAALANTQTNGRQPGKEAGELSDEQLAVCKQLGLSADDYKKSLAASH